MQNQYYSIPNPLMGQTAQIVPAVSWTTLASTLAVASAASIGSNMTDVRNGSMTVTQAVANGLIKGAAASTILARIPRHTAAEIVIACGALGVAGYMIDSVMKKNRQELCALEDNTGEIQSEGVQTPA